MSERYVIQRVRDGERAFAIVHDGVVTGWDKIDGTPYLSEGDAWNVVRSNRLCAAFVVLAP